ncbi:MAG: flagellar export protein FliJ [Proteobacteria bacterium]|nr:flagellar export protein FliJ [Pseudomonadota bacterium]
MKKFSFRLEKVLRYRKYLETKAQIKLVSTINEYNIIENSIKMIVVKRKELSGECSEEKRKGMDVARYRLYYHFNRKLNDDLEAGDLALKKSEATVILHRTLLKKESVKKKTLDTLKEVQSCRYRDISEKEEQKEMDETAIIRRIRITK